MKVLILQSSEQAASRAGGQIVAQVQTKADSVLGLATGGTMQPVYRHLVSRYRDQQVSFAKVRSFNLDEYVGLSPEHPCSYHFFMDQNLFAQTDFEPANVFLPKGDAPDPVVESDRYEELIQNVGPVDLQLLGIGSNGHIGFNEPTSSLGSRTRVKTLTSATRHANQRYFRGGAEPPKYAITAGIKTIMESREILLLATGPDKSAAVAAMVEGPLSAHCPASVLQLHPAVTIMLDSPAASDLKLREYFFEVHPDGKEVTLT